MKLLILKRLSLHVFGSIYRAIRYKSAYFFDTNFFLLHKNKLPKFIFTFNRKYLITESAKKEIIDKIGKKKFQEKINDKYKTIYFDDLWEKNQVVCPVYYHYISCILNPANVGSKDFYIEWRDSRRIKNIKLSAEEQKIYKNKRRRDIRGTSLDPLGNPRTGLIKFLDQLHSRTTKKAKKALQDNHPAYIQDIRSLALILIYALINRKNVSYYTSDGDAITLFIKWLDSLTMRLALNIFILPKLSSKNKQELLHGKTLEYFIDYNDFVKKRIGLFQDLCSDWWKEKGFQIKIKYWDQKARQFHNAISITLTEETADFISNLHGGLECNFAKNDILGNWLRYHYYWPPNHPGEKRIKIEVSRKNIINNGSYITDPQTHNKNCRYRKEDKSGNLNFLSQFF